MSNKQFLDKDGLQIVAEKVNEAREVGAGAMALAQEVSETSTIAFTGTFAEWNALSASEKAKFAGHIVNITDDTSDTVNAVRNPDWNRAVNYTINELYSGLQMPDDGIFIAVVQNRDKTSPGYENCLYIAGKKVGYCYETSASQIPEPIINCQVPVNKGDPIYLDGPSGAISPYNIIWFVPYKTEVVVTEPLNYSTEEQFTGKFWIDGKKIYRRVFQGTNDTPVTQNSRDAFNNEFVISGGVDTLITCDGSVSCYRTGETDPYVTQNIFAAMIDQSMEVFWGGRAFKSSAGLTQAFYVRENTFIKIDYSTVYEYTKTTD